MIFKTNKYFVKLFTLNILHKYLRMSKKDSLFKLNYYEIITIFYIKRILSYQINIKFDLLSVRSFVITIIIFSQIKHT